MFLGKKYFIEVSYYINKMKNEYVYVGGRHKNQYKLFLNKDMN